MQEVLQMIAQFGFPAVMCLLIWDSNRKLEDKLSGMLERNTTALVKTAMALDELRNTIQGGDPGEFDSREDR